jgi:hypothetical protein
VLGNKPVIVLVGQAPRPHSRAIQFVQENPSRIKLSAAWFAFLTLNSDDSSQGTHDHVFDRSVLQFVSRNSMGLHWNSPLREQEPLSDFNSPLGILMVQAGAERRDRHPHRPTPTYLNPSRF